MMFFSDCSTVIWDAPRLVAGTFRLVAGAPGLVTGAPRFDAVAPRLVASAPRLVASASRCFQVLSGAPNVLSGAPSCSQTYHNQSDGIHVPGIRHPSYSNGWPECPPRVSYSAEIDGSMFTLHILSFTPAGFQWLKYILLMFVCSFQTHLHLLMFQALTTNQLRPIPC